MCLSQSINLSSDTENLIVTDFLYVYDSLENITKDNFSKEKAQVYNASEFPIISGPSVFWIYFEVSNNDDYVQDYVFNFENWSHVDFYYREEVKKSGHRMAFRKRDYPFANKNLINVRMAENENLECIVRLEYTFNNEKKPSNLDFTVSSKEFTDTRNVSELVWTSVFIAIYCIMFFYNFFLYFSIKDKTYLYYLFLLAIMTYASFYNSGFLVSALGFIDSFPDFLMTYIKHILSPILAIAGIWFTQEFLNIKERYPKWNRFFNILSYILWAFVPLQFFAYEMTLGLIGLFGMLAFITSLIVAIKSVFDHYPSAQYFVLGYSFFIVGLFIGTLAILGVIPKTMFTFSYAMPIGSTIQMVFFSLALADKINVLRKENIENQTFIINQLKENQELQTKVNRELEHKVVERTKEINKQKDEIALQKSIIEQEKERAESLLLNILPKMTADELREKGTATPLYYENASVLFTDIVDFTSIAEELGPNELVKQLDECFRTFDEIISSYNLEKIKTIGDSYMCAGGILDQDENSIIGITKAALEIQDFISEWNKKKVAKGEKPWNLRIGIHSGPLTAGVVGKKKFAFDVWGDSVNIASRMETNCIPGKVNVSEATWNQIKDYFNGTPRGKLDVKNKGKVGMWFVDSIQEN